MEHQQKALDFILQKKKFALFMGYGTGKTLTILSYIIQKPEIKNIIIVGKKRNIIFHGIWHNEIEKHQINLTYEFITGTFEQKQEKIKSSNNLHFISYDSIISLQFQIAWRKYDMIILDESTMIKNPKAKRTKAIHAIIKHIPYSAILTGCPVSEHLQDLWSQYHIIDIDNRLETTFYKYLTKYFIQGRFGWNPRQTSKEKITNLIKINSFFCSTEKVLNLPIKKDIYYPIQCTVEQKQYIKQLQSTFSLVMQGKKLEYKYILPIIIKIQQISSGFIYLENNNVITFPTNKDQCLIDIISKILPNKIIIWCQYKQEIKHLIDFLQKQNYNTLALTTTNNDIITQFKISLDFNILITTYSQLESGESLIEANNAICYAPIWSYNKTKNAMARNRRKGSEQLHNQIIYHHIYTKNTIEEKIINTLQIKGNMVKALKQYMDKWRLI